MRVDKMITSLLLLLLLLSAPAAHAREADTRPAIDVLQRTIGAEYLDRFTLEFGGDPQASDSYILKKQGGKIHVTGNSNIALTRGVYDYLKNETNSIVSWSGSKLSTPAILPDVDRQVSTPYRYRYYFNVVTHGYTTAYWDWARWEQEIDWMALHGLNMPLIGGAHEAILARVFKKLGLAESALRDYFSGPAHFPWNRMGNLTGWDGPLPDSYFQQQIDLTHKMLDRMRELGMSPIVHAFAGFVPKGIREKFPEENIRELGWGGGLPTANNAFILSPTSDLFVKIGKLYIEEWEREFGRGEFYLADSFNEMDAPLSADPELALEELSGYGAAVYQSIKDANPDATWVMQGWTFPYHKDSEGKLFWTPERLRALMSQVPDDKLLILDMANEYNHAFWKIDPSWKMYDGFFGKKWVYSFIPNMGGKSPLNGLLDLYATLPFEALNYSGKQNLVGFGFAPEGIENNEMIYELLSDVAWTRKKIDLDEWIKNYSHQRYGAYPAEIKKAYALLCQSALGSFTDHPMHRYQFRPYDKPEGVEDHATVHRSAEFRDAVGAFLEAAPTLRGNRLYTYDAIELVTQYLGLVADHKLLVFLDTQPSGERAILDESMDILLSMDRLLASHPNRKLDSWLTFARSWGHTEAERNYYEANARRLLTTWGGDPVNDYAGRVWSGLIRDYYVPRWQAFHSDTSSDRKANMRAWEEDWINASGTSVVEQYSDPLSVAIEIFDKYKKHGF